MGLFSWAKRLSSGRDAAPAIGLPAAQPEADAVARGVALLQAGKFIGACDAFKEAIAQRPDVAANHVNLAYALQQVNAEAQTVSHLRRAVVLDAGSFDAQYMLGGALERLPDLNGAAYHLRQALALRPDFEPAHADLCRVLALNGEVVQARAALDVAIALNPENADFHNYLGNLYMTTDAVAAEESYRRALNLRPGFAQAHGNLGLALHSQNRLDDAVSSFEKALEFDPASNEFQAKLGLALKAQGDLAAATEWLQRALVLRPDDAEVLNHLGMALADQGLIDRAIPHYQRAMVLRPDWPGVHVTLGLALYGKGLAEMAIEIYRKGLAIEPIADLHANLAIALQRQGIVDEALEHFQRAIELQPENLDIKNNLASAFADSGDRQRAIATFREIVEAQPGHLIAHCNLLFHCSVDDQTSPAEYLAEARRFEAKLTQEPLPPRHGVAANPSRLRVGFVSGDLHLHPVGFFIEGILKHLDATRLELFAYSSTPREDALTARIKPRFARWQLLTGLSDRAAAEAIRADQIDILIDLSGHTGDNRLPVFAYRPAPVQISWLGFFASTGMSSIDYVLADEACVPAGSEHLFAEKIWRLPGTRLCFTPPPDAVALPVAPLPALRHGHVTFGCFQRLPKINDPVLSLWGQVFAALPNARLLLQCHQTGRAVYVEQILARLAAVGIAADRVTVRGPAMHNSYLRSYADVDIVLDTFPYTGGTTTCEALWMGVPTLTLMGETMIARQGVAMMRAAGLPEWVAQSPADYVRKAVEFGSNIDRLAALRASLRERLPATPLFDVRTFAGHLSVALADIWRGHVSQPRSPLHGDNRLTQTVASQANESD